MTCTATAGLPGLAGAMQRRTTWAVLTLAAAIMSVPWRAHLDDVDAQFYRVVVRHMLEDDTWFDLRFLPRLFPQFREHVPFGFWPWAAAARISGEGALGPVSGVFTLVTLWLVLRLGRRLGGEVVGVTAALVLVATDSFLLIGGRSRLDPLLYLLTTASLMPVLGRTPSVGGWAVGAAFAALGALVKGPFGMLPFAAASTAVAWERRSWRLLAAGAGATLASAVPLAAFLIWQRVRGDPTWWSLYVEGQLLASALGRRAIGHGAATYPLSSLGTRFWPGLPLVAVGLWRAARGEGPPGLRRVALTAVLVVLGLMLPARKVWNHVLAVYPLLALLCGFALAPWLARSGAVGARWARGLPALLGLAAALTGLLGLAGLGRVFHRPCVVADEFSPALRGLAPGSRVGVVTRLEPWSMISIVAAETDFAPEPKTAPDWEAATGPDAMLVRDDLDVGPPPAPWRVVGHARHWTLLRR